MRDLSTRYTEGGYTGRQRQGLPRYGCHAVGPRMAPEQLAALAASPWWLHTTRRAARSGFVQWPCSAERHCVG